MKLSTAFFIFNVASFFAMFVLRRHYNERSYFARIGAFNAGGIVTQLFVWLVAGIVGLAK